MISIDLSHDLDQLTRRLDDLSRRHVPYAASLAINEVAGLAQKKIGEEIKRSFDRPTPWIQRGTFLLRSNKTNLTATVGIKDTGRSGATQAHYLRDYITGTRRSAKPYERALRSAGLLPDGWVTVAAAGIKKDAYGNPSRKALAELFGALRSGMNVYGGRGRRAHTTGYFVVLPGVTHWRSAHLSPGVWKRLRSATVSTVIPVLRYVRTAQYDARLDLPEIVGTEVRRHFHDAFERALAKAMETA